MTDRQKLAACLRICGLHVTPETHSIAPELCPIALDYWRNPKLRPETTAPPAPKASSKTPSSTSIN